jgi:hypothetical protein
MKTRIQLYLFAVLLINVISNCTPSAKLYKNGDKKSIYTGRLEDADYNYLKQLLVANTNMPLKDTLIIKYDYNHETCWDVLDQKPDEHITSFITTHQARVQKFRELRPNVSLFEYREPGKFSNKLKKWNTSIIVDSSKQLYKLLFSERTTCGSSIIILPTKNFIFFRSDAHSMAMDYTQEQIKKLLHIE